MKRVEAMNDLFTNVQHEPGPAGRWEKMEKKVINTIPKSPGGQASQPGLH